MWTEAKGKKGIGDYRFRRVTVHLESGRFQVEEIPCADVEDFLGGIARSFKLLGRYRVREAYDPSSPLVMDLGNLSGTDTMTGLRVFFSAYSPLKVANNGMPLAMWSAASGDFGTRMAAAEVDQMVFFGRAPRPTYLVIRGEGGRPTFALEDASPLLGKTTHEKILWLLDRHRDAHFCAIGPSGENWRSVRYAGIACSTGNQLASRDNKPRFAGRGGMGGIMGSKNLLAIVAQAPYRKGGQLTPKLVEVNKEIARGEGSRNYRDADKGNGAGGTWRNIHGLHPLGALPERNFRPTGGDGPVSLYRGEVEKDYFVKDESCFKCGIGCHKNVYEAVQADGKKKAGRFYTKFDYEPLDLLAVNLEIYDPKEALEIVELVDQMGLDAISLGVVLGYIMEYNERHPDRPIFGGLRFGDWAGACALIRRIAAGEEPRAGQGVKRLSEELGETAYAMQCKGLELPAYLPETNPGYPFAIAGGHMSMRTFLLLIFEGKTDLDYWENAIVNRGVYYTRDDAVGLCKFAGTPDGMVLAAIEEICGVRLSQQEMNDAILRTYLRGLLLERRQGTTYEDYVLPAQAYEPNPNVKLPHFTTPEFMAELRERVFRRFEEKTRAFGLEAELEKVPAALVG